MILRRHRKPIEKVIDKVEEIKVIEPKKTGKKTSKKVGE